MTDQELELVRRFKALVEQKLHVHQMIVFGSRARGDAERDSDMDVLIVIEEPETQSVSQFVSDCAWEACFNKGIILSPVIFSRDEWENSPERSGFLAQAVRREGVPV